MFCCLPARTGWLNCCFCLLLLLVCVCLLSLFRSQSTEWEFLSLKVFFHSAAAVLGGEFFIFQYKNSVCGFGSISCLECELQNFTEIPEIYPTSSINSPTIFVVFALFFFCVYFSCSFVGLVLQSVWQSALFIGHVWEGSIVATVLNFLYNVVGRLMAFTYIIRFSMPGFVSELKDLLRSLSRKVNSLFDKVFFGLCILIII